MNSVRICSEEEASKLKIDPKIKKRIYYEEELSKIFNFDHGFDEFCFALNNGPLKGNQFIDVLEEIEVIGGVANEFGLGLTVRGEYQKDNSEEGKNDRYYFKYSVIIGREK